MEEERAADIAKLENAKEAVEAELKSMRQDAATSNLSPLERSRRERVAQRLRDFTADEKEVLKYLLHHGATDPRSLRDCGEVPKEAIGTAYGKARDTLIITIPPAHWDIKPELKKALEFHLLGE